MPHNILIVDDEPNIVVPLQFLMEQKGYAVRVATSGEEAVAAAAEQPPDLVLLDIMLPGIDGFETCQRIRDLAGGDSIRILFLTAMGQDMDMAKGLSLGADDYIVKPFSNADVVARARRLLT